MSIPPKAAIYMIMPWPVIFQARKMTRMRIHSRGFSYQLTGGLPNCTPVLNFLLFNSWYLRADLSSIIRPKEINSRFNKIVFTVALAAEPEENRYSKFLVKGLIYGMPNMPSAKLKSLKAVISPNMGR